MTIFENLNLNLREVAKVDLEEMIRNCERELDRREEEARDGAMKKILDTIYEYVEEFGSLEIEQSNYEETVSIYVNRNDTLISNGNLISVVLA